MLEALALAEYDTRHSFLFAGWRSPRLLDIDPAHATLLQKVREECLV
ncbi:MAG: hypothetical protein OJF62_000501 [Pseudolabrys sp.]|jgi:hypothetical protein|nr:hypothetical protein [Pseudolabrys sp.]